VLQTDGWTDGRTTYDSNTALALCASRGKKGVTLTVPSPSVLPTLDISAAFDTLQHIRLLQRAKNLFGRTGKTKEWLSSYLSNRSSCVALGDQRFSSVSSSTGVPQG